MRSLRKLQLVFGWVTLPSAELFYLYTIMGGLIAPGGGIYSGGTIRCYGIGRCCVVVRIVPLSRDERLGIFGPVLRWRVGARRGWWI